MKRVSLSLKDARCLLDICDGGAGCYGPDHEDAERHLKAAVDHATRVRPALRAAKQRREVKRKTKRERTSEIREEVMKRAGLVCECGCGRWFRGFNGAAQLDHYDGRARSESVETCWALRADCHREKTDGVPSSIEWHERFLAHAQRHGYATAAICARRRIGAEELILAAEGGVR